MQKSLAQNIRKNPWGAPQSVLVFGDNIAIISTASHGGAVLSDGYAQQMGDDFLRVQPWTGDRRFWEEDCDLAVIFLAFPKHFDAQTVEAARRVVGRGCNGAERARAFGAPWEATQ